MLVDCALLTLWGNRLNVDHALWIEAETETRVARICERNGFSEKVSRERVISQMILFQPPKSEKLWSTIDNSENIKISESAGVRVIDSYL